MHPTARTNPRAIHVALRHMRDALCGRIRAMLAETDAGFIHRFPHLVAGIEAGFRHEQTILELRGDARARARREDNATILRALHRIAPQVELGNVDLGRQVAAALHQVLGAHGLTSDLAPVPHPLPVAVRWRAHSRSPSRPAWSRHMRHRH